MYSGAGAGWWIYNKTLTAANSETYLAQDRTHLALMIPYGTDMLVRLKRFRVGAGFTYRQLLDDVMVGSEHSPINYDIYPVAAYNIELLQYHLTAEYRLAKEGKYIFSPQMKAGSFQLYADHPKKAEFKSKYFIETGFNVEREISKMFSFFIRPEYLLMIIEGKKFGNNRETHQIYGMGLQFGIRLILNEDRQE